MQERKYILFDLDGTLVTPTRYYTSVSHALKHFGIEGDPKIPEDLYRTPTTNPSLHFDLMSKRPQQPSASTDSTSMIMGFSNEGTQASPNSWKTCLRLEKLSPLPPPRPRSMPTRLWTTSSSTDFSTRNWLSVPTSMAGVPIRRKLSQLSWSA